MTTRPTAVGTVEGGDAAEDLPPSKTHINSHFSEVSIGAPRTCQNPPDSTVQGFPSKTGRDGSSTFMRYGADRGQRAEGGAVGDHVVLVEDVGALAQGSVALSLRTTTQPLHTRFTRIIGASLSGVTMRPDPTVSPASKSRPPRWQSPPWQLSTASQPMDSRPGHEP